MLYQLFLIHFCFRRLINNQVSYVQQIIPTNDYYKFKQYKILIQLCKHIFNNNVYVILIDTRRMCDNTRYMCNTHRC